MGFIHVRAWRDGWLSLATVGSGLHHGKVRLRPEAQRPSRRAFTDGRVRPSGCRQPPSFDQFHPAKPLQAVGAGRGPCAGVQASRPWARRSGSIAGEFLEHTRVGASRTKREGRRSGMGRGEPHGFFEQRRLRPMTGEPAHGLGIWVLLPIDWMLRGRKHNQSCM
jgi:hypothetical protein